MMLAMRWAPHPWSGRGALSVHAGRWPPFGALAAWGSGAIAVAGVGGGLWFMEQGGGVTVNDALLAVPFAVFGVVGALIAERRPGNILGWLCCAVGVAIGVYYLSSYYGQHVLHDGGGGATVTVAAWLAAWTPAVGLGVLLVFVPLTFPTGALPSRRWRPVGWSAAGVIATATVAAALQQGPVDEDLPVRNPLSLSGADQQLEATIVLAALATLCLSIASLTSLLFRYRVGDLQLRLQVKWLLAGGAIAVAGTAASVVAGLAGVGDGVLGGAIGVLAHLGLLIVPIAIGVAVLRHRLLDIDLIISRGVVYAVLTVCVVAGYAACIAVLMALSGDEPDATMSLVATGVVALVFAPLRHVVQHHVDRFVYGDRGDPYAVVSRLGRRLEQADATQPLLLGIVDEIAASLKLPFVAIEGPDGTVAGVHGEPAGEVVRLPLTHGPLTLGHLVVSPRTPGEQLDASDLRLLDDLARLAALAARSVALADDLQTSRERIVTAREEELRRLRRELHDGLGPTLAGAALRLEAGRRVHGQDPAIDALLVSVKAEIQSALADVRRTVYDLRPPALDDVGLIEALRRRADNLAVGFVASVEADEPLGDMPAAVEAAAFRIAAEAITNCAVHAAARTCRVSLHRHDSVLEVEIVDDGRGIAPGCHRGVGLSAMQERAAELGGDCVVDSPLAGGTRVKARLPCGRP